MVYPASLVHPPPSHTLTTIWPYPGAQLLSLHLIQSQLLLFSGALDRVLMVC